MKKQVKLAFLGIALILLINFVSVLLYTNFLPILLSPGDSIHIPTSCSNSEIMAAWDSIFQESNSGITIKTNTNETNKCNSYLALKISGENIWILAGRDFEKIIKITALYVNSTTEYQNNMSSLNVTSNRDDFASTIISSFYPEKDLKNRSLSLAQVPSSYSSIFEISQGTWGAVISSSRLIYIFEETGTSGYSALYNTGVVMANHTASWFIFTNTTIPPQNCTPNWISHNATCGASEESLTYYTDSRACNQTAPTNITEYCDFNNNGIIGNFSDLSQTNINTRIYINNFLANDSKVYNRTETIEFKEGNTTRIKFSHDFSSPLNIKIISITKQPDSSSFGYVIIENINISKIVTIDKKNSSSNAVCIKNMRVSSISELTSNCTSTDEYSVFCPGSSATTTCEIANSTFLVSGITRSAIKEYTKTGTGILGCITNFTCTNWASCINDQQVRVCTDLNNCNNNASKPAETQTCISCAANWSCSSWGPKRCPSSGQQKTTCIDTNACNKTAGKPSETRTCDYEKPSYFFWIVIIILIVLIVIITIAIIYVWNKEQEPSFTR